jgi:hypothetical protein
LTQGNQLPWPHCFFASISRSPAFLACCKPPLARGIRSRAGGDKRKVPESPRHGKKASVFVGRPQKPTRREYPLLVSAFQTANISANSTPEIQRGMIPGRLFSWQGNGGGPIMARKFITRPVPPSTRQGNKSLTKPNSRPSPDRVSAGTQSGRPNSLGILQPRACDLRRIIRVPGGGNS